MKFLNSSKGFPILINIALSGMIFCQSLDVFAVNSSLDSEEENTGKRALKSKQQEKADNKDQTLALQQEQASLLKMLHIKGSPLILFNIWDPGSAKIIADEGAKAIATGSWSVAASYGEEDGEKLSFELALANLRRIVRKVSLPVTLDMEGGYGRSPEEIQQNVVQVIKAGAVGVNFEDQVIGKEELYSIEEQCKRIKAMRKAANEAFIPDFFLNARTDIFLNAKPINHTLALVEEALERASAYEKAGASGFFVPGLKNPTFIKKLCDHSSLPVNILALPGTPSSKQLAKLGVARISYGPIPYRLTMKTLQEAGRKALLMAFRHK